MVQVVWTRDAAEHVDLIRAYIAQFDPKAAQRLAGRLIGAGDSLCDYPNRGRPTNDGLRELATIAPYVILYEVLDETVNILSIKHGSQRR